MMMKSIIQNEKGMTLVEILVSMSIFAVVMTLTMGFFITLQGIQVIYREKADLHQEGRIVAEIFSKHAREAVQVKQNGTDICASNTNYVAFRAKKTDTTWLVFACTQDSPTNPRYVRMGSEINIDSLIADPAGTINNMPFISSGQVTVTKLEVTRSSVPTYPKTLRYNIEVDRYLSNRIAEEGEKIYFPGYLVMKNEQ